MFTSFVLKFSNKSSSGNLICWTLIKVEEQAHDAKIYFNLGTLPDKSKSSWLGRFFKAVSSRRLKEKFLAFPFPLFG